MMSKRRLTPCVFMLHSPLDCGASACRTLHLCPSPSKSHNETWLVQGLPICRAEAICNSQIWFAKCLCSPKSKSQHVVVNDMRVSALEHIQIVAFLVPAFRGTMLHLVLLGWLKYVVKSFFKQIWQNSIASK